MFVKLANRVINLNHVASVERHGEQSLLIHWAVPDAATVSGVSFPMGGTPPVATGHLMEYLNGEEAVEFWKQVTAA